MVLPRGFILRADKVIYGSRDSLVSRVVFAVSLGMLVALAHLMGDKFAKNFSVSSPRDLWVLGTSWSAPDPFVLVELATKSAKKTARR